MRFNLLGALAVSLLTVTTLSTTTYADDKADRVEIKLGILRAQLKGLGVVIDTVDRRGELGEFKENLELISSQTENLLHARKFGTRRDIFDAQRNLDEAVARTRTDFHRTDWRVNNNILNIWYLLNVTYSEAKRILNSDNQDDEDDDNSYDDRVSFSGEFGKLAVRFDGRTHRELFERCTEFMKSESIRVNEMKIGGKTVYTGSTYWEKNQLCGIAVLNATVSNGESDPAVVVSGKFSSLPFNIATRSIRSLGDLLDLAMEGIGEIRTNEIRIGNDGYYGGNFYWSTTAIKAVIRSNIERPRKKLVSRGKLSVSPFIFAGNDVDEIRAQCENYFVAVYETFAINELRVNGSTRYGGSTSWNAAQACMMVGSLAISQ